MSTAARDALDRHAPPWLFVAALATTAPHAFFLPAWASLTGASLLGWGLWLWWTDRRLPGRWPLVLLVMACSAAVFAEYRTLLGRDAGVALLVLFMAMKPLELRSRRDASVIVVLGLFLLLTHYFHSQGIGTALWLFASIWLLTAVLVRISAGPLAGWRMTARHAGLLCLQALPFLVVLYLLFPRVSGPLWGLPQDANAGRTGLSDTMTPGSIAQLVQNGDIAFRARFSGPPPGRERLYWRGPVLDEFDGTTWRIRRGTASEPVVEALSAEIHYETTLEAHSQNWLLALDAPRKLPNDSHLTPTLSVQHRTPINDRARMQFSSSLDYRFNVAESPSVLQRNLVLPERGNPRTRALAREWTSRADAPERLIGRALALFNREFTYTLRPPLLGRDGIDDFLFVTRRGFCEHYAGAFVYLMRSAGVPARVVTGYQGGERNPLDGYLVVRQSDAHAWAEVWLAGRGWVRIDPTAAVSPSRIETGIADALAAGEPLPALVHLRADWLRDLRHRWEAVNNAWNQHLIGYGLEQQKELLKRIGLPDADWQGFATLLAATCGLLLAALTAWATYRRPLPDPALKLWQKALRHARRSGVNCAPWETPDAVCARVSEHCPALATRFRQVTDAYLRARYGSAPDELKNLRTAIAKLAR